LMQRSEEEVDYSCVEKIGEGEARFIEARTERCTKRSTRSREKSWPLRKSVWTSNRADCQQARFERWASSSLSDTPTSCRCEKWCDQVTQFFNESHLCLVFEFMDFDLKGYLKHRGVLEVAESRQIISQILQGLRYAHTNQILHRDLKPQNILVKSDGTVKIADFGLARTVSNPVVPLTPEVDRHEQVVTLWYRSPELILGLMEYSVAVDIWSVGVIMCSRDSLRRDDHEKALLSRRLRNRPAVQDIPDLRDSHERRLSDSSWPASL